jgi:hypothetical protein
MPDSSAFPFGGCRSVLRSDPSVAPAIFAGLEPIGSADEPFCAGPLGEAARRQLSDLSVRGILLNEGS